MPEFTYTAKQRDGQVARGVIMADDRRQALANLVKQSLVPLQVQVKSGWNLNALKLPIGKRVRGEIMASTLAQMSELLENGVSLLESLDILAKQSTSPVMREVLLQIRGDVAQGVNIDQAMAKHSVFDELTLSMVRAGAEGAFLEDALKRISIFLERREELKGKVTGALAYPAFLLVGGLIVTVVLIVVFVPRFEALFSRLEKSGVGLPGPTVVLLGASDFLRSYGVLVCAAVLGLLVGFNRWAQTTQGRWILDGVRLKLPIFGQILHHSAVARFCRVLGTLLTNGVPIVKALQISSSSTGNKRLEQAILRSCENIKSGETLSAPLTASGLVPPAVMAMIHVAERSNTLDSVLIRIAERTELKIEQQLGTMVRMIEPLTLVLIGGLVTFVLAGLLLPIFDMSAAI
ncbi:MAG: type II secretion system F family protein [Planctomycetaceae bacterium]|nr:type II secretion system F family protein [Planctomycetaceae bacterium]